MSGLPRKANSLAHHALFRDLDVLAIWRTMNDLEAEALVGEPRLELDDRKLGKLVTQMAKVFTGWTYPTAAGATAKVNNPAYYFGQMIANESA